MLKHLRFLRRRLDERRRYLELLSTLERINAADVGEADLGLSLNGSRQVFGGGRR